MMTASIKRLLAERLEHMRRIRELEEENARLRLQRDAANAQIQFLTELLQEGLK